MSAEQTPNPDAKHDKRLLDGLVDGVVARFNQGAIVSDPYLGEYVLTLRLAVRQVVYESGFSPELLFPMLVMESGICQFDDRLVRESEGKNQPFILSVDIIERATRKRDPWITTQDLQRRVMSPERVFLVPENL